MYKKYKILFSFLLIFILTLTIGNLTVLGQDSFNTTGNSTTIHNEVKKINNDIQDKKSEIKRLQKKQAKYANAIKQKQQEKASLNNQLAILDNKVAKAELDLELTQTEIERIELEIAKTDQNIKNKNKDIEIQKTKIANILKLINQKDKASSLEIILLNNSLSEFMNRIKYLEDMNAGVKKSLDNLKNLKHELNKEKADLKKQNQDFIELKIKLQERKDALEADKETKLMVVSQISSSEQAYQHLLAQSKKEQQDAAAEIVNMEKIARAKLASLNGKKLELNDNGFIWPVKKDTITTYFHDPDYPFRHIFEHPAIDIRAAQNSTLRAAASGYVARAKNNGLGYSYIMLVHGDGLSTVYGHVSKIYVKQDEYVVQGQVIGKTGGLPGTPGAGRLTTGPHLHFEIRLNGIPVDPLGYLP